MKLRHDLLVHGVYIITARAGERAGGLAVAWSTQVGTDRFLIAVGKQSATRELILTSGAFGLHVLRTDQVAIGNWFGRQSIRHADKFEDIPVLPGKSGAPILEDCGAAYSCEVDDVFERGAQKLIVGRILRVEIEPGVFQPLIYREEDYPIGKPQHPYRADAGGTH